MTYLSDAHHSRKMVAGACMVIAPLLVLVSEVIHPAEKSSSREQLAVIARHLDRWYAAHLIALVAIALLVPAVLGLMHMLRERQVAWGHVGGGLGLICLAIGLYRARVVPSWVSLFLVVAAACFAVELAASINAFGIVAAAFLFVGLGSVGRVVLTESDEDWEHTPEHRGFRPLLGMR